LAHDLIAKKCGIASVEEPLDHMTLQDYLDMYKKPLTDATMKTIVTLSEVVGEKKMSKLKKKKWKKANIIGFDIGNKGNKKGAVKETKHVAIEGKREKDKKGKKIKNQKLTPLGVPL
jgi:hypothetical protein